MDSEGKQKFPSKVLEESTNIHQTEMTPSALFLPQDVILEVEGIQLHVHKKVLADNSPVFQRMFESEFREKHQTKIHLPGKKLKDIEEFLWSFYHPEIIRPITEEYQVSEVKDRCEDFIVRTLEEAINHEIERPDLRTLLKYISCAELYNLSCVLPLAVNMCAKYTTESMTVALLQIPVSGKTLLNICIERTKLTETLTKGKIDKGDFHNVLETFEFLMNDEDEGKAMRKYEKRLTKACAEAAISTNNLVEFIIAGEKLDLEKLLSSAITLASQCKSKALKNHRRYQEISEDTQNQINEKRVTFLEEKGVQYDKHLK